MRKMVKSNFRFFFGSFLVFISLVVAINIWVNPYSFYGLNSIGNPVTHNDRLSKSVFFENHKLETEAIFLGSSNSMRFYPEWIEDEFNLKAYNFGVFQASVEDFYCLINYILEKNPNDLKLVFFNLDDWNFAQSEQNSFDIWHPANNRLSSVEYLAKYLRGYNLFTYKLAKYKTAISYDQFGESINNIFQSAFKPYIISTQNVFHENGVRKNYTNRDRENVTQLAEDGNYNVTEYLKKRIELLKTFPGAGKLESHEFFKEFSNQRLELFEELISILNENDVKIIINIMPIQPYEQSIVEKETNYLERVSFMENWLNNLKEQHRNILLIKNNSKIENFNGYENHFFDAIHPTSVNSKLMFESILKELPKDAI